MIFSVYPNGWYVDISWVGVRLSEAFTRSSYPDDKQPPTTNFSYFTSCQLTNLSNFPS